ncbi:glycerol kinase GlpK [Lentilactobacillus laojiaonis]|uniref:glycerol kinase GlpK n=1 Tax=Lentilactobacillus laojiaonis TaxID=2883998 RepID=UPI001D0AFC23|nr:glycerol kinase GlpK [Lentilactobacillus laojiaonis]UDM32057.1 glycerol kinase GlpK [Lentilactobacillus laojiaonis]
MLNDKEKYILSIDQGTTSTRAMIFDHTGRKVIEGYKHLDQIIPHNGWVEQDANDIWNSVLTVISSALIDAGIHPEDISGIGISNQRETTVIWDKTTGEPIYNAVGWQSKQTAHITKKLEKDGYEDLIHKKTGLIIDSYFSATKIRWILDNVPGAQERAEKGELLFGTIDTWLVWKLSGGRYHITDYSNASRTMLFNIHALRWDEDILKLLNIPRIMLPEVKTSSEVYGTTQNYQFYGIEVPIAGIAGDQQAALIGQMAFEPGMIKNTYGDGAFIMMNTGDTPELSDENLLTTIAYNIGGKVTYALEGSIFIAGTAVTWLADEMHMIDSVPESRQAAMESNDNDDLYLVPAFNGLGAPYWDEDVRGSVFGLTRNTNRDDFVKATLQSIAYGTRDIIETMEKDTKMHIPMLMADGGSSRNRYLMQFQADILNIPIKRASDEDTTAFGAAILAGLSVGFWKDIDEIKNFVEDGRLFEPNMPSDKRKRLYRGWKAAVTATRAFRWTDCNEK